MIKITSNVKAATPAPARKAALKLAKANIKKTSPAKPVTRHEADTANETMIADAVSFKVSLFLGRGQYDRSEVSTLQLAANRAAEIKAAHPACTREPMVHGITATNHTMLVPPALLPAPQALPGAMLEQFRASVELLNTEAPTIESALIGQIRAALPDVPDDLAEIMAETAQPGPAPVAEPAAAVAQATLAAKPTRAVSGKRAEALAMAERGILPQPPDFSAETHKNHRKKLAALIVLAKDGDIAGLHAFHINPVSTSPKALDRYRNLCVAALSAQAKAA